MPPEGAVFGPSRFAGRYVGKATQATTAAPALSTAVLNTLSLSTAPATAVTLTPARTSIGLYTVTASAAVFTAGKTFARINGGTGAAMRVFCIEYTSTTVITINVFDLGATPALADSGDFDIEIEVYA